MRAYVREGRGEFETRGTRGEAHTHTQAQCFSTEQSSRKREQEASKAGLVRSTLLCRGHTHYLGKPWKAGLCSAVASVWCVWLAATGPPGARVAVEWPEWLKGFKACSSSGPL